MRRYDHSPGAMRHGVWPMHGVGLWFDDADARVPMGVPMGVPKVMWERVFPSDYKCSRENEQDNWTVELSCSFSRLHL